MMKQEKSSLEKCQKEIEDAAKEIAHKTNLESSVTGWRHPCSLTKMERDHDVWRVPTKNVALEEAARSSRFVERRVLRKQARRARAEYMVKCRL